jgi:hypothetical protein
MMIKSLWLGIIVTDEAGRVANVFKQLMREDLEVLK